MDNRWISCSGPALPQHYINSDQTDIGVLGVYYAVPKPNVVRPVCMATMQWWWCKRVRQCFHKRHLFAWALVAHWCQATHTVHPLTDRQPCLSSHGNQMATKPPPLQTCHVSFTFALPESLTGRTGEGCWWGGGDFILVCRLAWDLFNYMTHRRLIDQWLSLWPLQTFVVRAVPKVIVYLLVGTLISIKIRTKPDNREYQCFPVWTQKCTTSRV